MADATISSESSGTSAVATPPVTGAHAAAILLMLLDEAEAASILKLCGPDEVRTLGGAMFATMGANERDIAAALDRFVGASRALPSLSVNAEPRIRNVMTAAIGNVRADTILLDIAPEASAPSLNMLRWMDSSAIAHLLATEPAQVGAIILAALTPEVAAQALEGLDEARQSDLVFRSARLTSISTEALCDLQHILSHTSAPAASGQSVRLGGSSDAARIVNNLKKPASDKLLKSLKKRDRQLAQSIEDEMIVFGSLTDLDSKALGELMRAVDAATLGLALRGAEPALVDKMLSAMSARAAQTLRDDMAESAPAKRADVEDAQKVVIGIARGLADAGTISLGAQANDYV
jgi:flagellar motor switch protein FliG